MKILIIVPDGLGIRNFIFSKFLDLLTEVGEVVIWHSFSKKLIDKLPAKFDNHNVNWRKLPTYKETPVERISRYARIFAQIHWKKTERLPLELKLLRTKQGLNTQIINSLAEIGGYFFSTKSKISFLDDIHLKYTKSNQQLDKFKKVLLKEKPDIVCCTHQRANLAIPAVTAAKSLDITTATFIYSWDNLPKNRMGVQPDYYFVWGEKMREEMLEFYPNIKQNRVFNVGTPQFEFYFDPDLKKSKEQFFSELNLDTKKKVICFSGDDAQTSPYDPYFLADLAEAVRTIGKKDRPQILFRQCPVDKSDRFDWVLEKYPEIAVSEPLWEAAESKRYSGIIPKIDDVILLTNIVHYCDLVVNLGSTMAMDFAVLNKPAIYFAYNPVEDNPKKNWDVEAIYRLSHFDSIHETQPVYWANNPEELPGLIDRALNNSGEKSCERKKWLDKMLTFPIEKSSRRIVDKLIEIAS